MDKKPVLVLVGIMLCACERSDPTQPRLVADVVSDVTPPTLSAFSISPTSVDASDGPVSVTMNFTVTDDLSGATSITVSILNPAGTMSTGYGTSFAAAASQTGSFSVPFAQYSASGDWTVQQVSVFDAAGNYRSLSTADLAAMGLPTVITVLPGSEDVTAPTLMQFDIEPKTVSTNDGPASVTVNFAITDDLSGATSITVSILNPAGTVSTGYGTSFPAATSQTGSFTVPFAQYSASGDWAVQQVSVFDAAGNVRSFSTADLAALGFPTVISVANALNLPIDIQPGSNRNSIKVSKKGKVTVAILSDSRFDAPSWVARETLSFGHTGTEASLASCAKEGEDVNGDGLLDLVCQFYVQQTGLQVGDVEGVLRGRTTDEIPIEGRDAVRILR